VKKRFTLPAAIFAASAFVFATSVPAVAATTYTVGVINMSNKQANPEAIAVDSATGNLYVGQQEGALGAKIAALSPTGQLRTYIRVGESFDPAMNVPPDGESGPPFTPSRVIALSVNPNTNTLIALVTGARPNPNENYSQLSGCYVVLVNMSTNEVVKRYTVAQPWPNNGPTTGPQPVFVPDTMWTGFALDVANNVLWGVEGYDPRWSNNVNRLNLSTGVRTRAPLPGITSGSTTPYDSVPTIAFNKSNGRGYVSLAGTVYGIDNTLKIVSTLHVPGVDPACPDFPGSTPTATVASPATNTVYVNYCGAIYVINGGTNTVTHPIPTAGFSSGLVLDAPAQSLYTAQTRSGVRGIAIYSTATKALLKFVPLNGGGGPGNAWIANNPVLHKTYVPTSASTISGIVSR
jgi:hypothetical protein